MTSPATVGGDDSGERPLRLFLALEVPADVSAALRAWASRQLAGLRGVDRHHVTLAFLGSRPARELDGVLGALREACAVARRGRLEVVRYRETRSVSMFVLADPSGACTALANDLQGRLETLGVYRPEPRAWLPHVTVARFRDRPRLSPPLPELEPFAPSAAAAFLSRLHPSGARYETLETCPLSEESGVGESRED